MELLEIAKANAAKALGTANLDLPSSLRNVSLSKTNLGFAVPNGAKFEVSFFSLLNLQKRTDRSNLSF